MAVLRSLTALMVALFMMGAGVQDTLLLCRSLATTHHSCCCEHALELPALGEELSSAPCCDAATALSPAIPPSSGAASIVVLAEPVRIEAGFGSPAPLSLENDLGPATRTQVPRATGPPLHIKHRALLI